MSLSKKIFISLILAIVVGCLAGESRLPFLREWIAPIGVIFTNLIKMMIVPVIFTAVVAGITSIGSTNRLARIGAKMIGMWLLTTSIAIIIGFGVGTLAEPGIGLSIASETEFRITKPPNFMDGLVSMVPASPLDAMAKEQTLPIIVFAVFLGVGILRTGGNRAELLIKFFDACSEVCYKLIDLIMKLSPIGVFALAAPIAAANGPKVLLPWISVVACVAVGCFIHASAVYSAMVRHWGGCSPVRFFRGVSEAMMIAFTTCSSTVALPINMKTCEKNLGVSRGVSSFVLPIGNTVNMDGTSLYMGVCSLFIANVFGVSLSLEQMLVIILTGALASISAAGVPGAGFIMLSTVLNTVGLPVEGLALVAGIDRVLDMFRACLNTIGNAAVALVINEEERRHAAKTALYRAKPPVF